MQKDDMNQYQDLEIEDNNDHCHSNLVEVANIL